MAEFWVIFGEKQPILWSWQFLVITLLLQSSTFWCCLSKFAYCLKNSHFSTYLNFFERRTVGFGWFKSFLIVKWSKLWELTDQKYW